jgi:hypothetical protein
MDKNRAKITVKFGQAEGTHYTPVKPQPMPVKSPVELEDKPPQIQTVMEIAHEVPAKEEMAASFETINQEEIFGAKYVPGLHQKKGVGHAPRRKNRQGASRKKIVAVGSSIIGAVAVGLIFGGIALNFFKSGGFGHAPGGLHPTTVTSKSTSPSSAVQEQNAAAAINTESNKTTTTAKSPITLPATDYFVVQAGVFQEQANAATMLDKIKTHGWPNTFVGDKPQYLLLGMAVNRDNALSLANQYKDFDVFIKEFKEEAKTVSIPLKEGVKTSQEEWDQWFEKESEFIKIVGKAIGQGLSTGKLGDEMFQSVTEAHRNLLEKGRDLIGKLPDQSQEQGNRLLNDYTKIVNAMEHYQKQPGEGFLWQAEQGLLDSYQSKKQLFSSFK